MPAATPARISLPDRYRVVRHLANGGMASVWEAHDELLDRDVAVKVLASHLGEDERARRRFQREARAAAGLSSHPYVVTIYDVGEWRDRVFMVMELMRGGTVGDRIRSGRPIPHEEALRWLREAAGALDTAHENGVVHRDIKPGNLLLDEHSRLAVADFGIARLAWEDQLTATGQVLGTAAYLSPEQAMGEPATAASDRYALAVVAYELLVGARPFEAEHFAAQARAHVEDPVPPASSRTEGLSRAVDAVLERGLAKDPADRWDSATQFVGELQRSLASGAEREEASRPTRRLKRREAAPVAVPARDDTPARPQPAVVAGGRGANGNGRLEAPPEEPPRRRSGAPLLAGLGALALLAVVAAVALASRGGNDPNSTRAESTPKATRTATPAKTRTATPEPTDTATPTATATATDTPTAEPTKTATPEPTDTPTPKPPKKKASGTPDLKAATAAQLAGYNARTRGDYSTALAKAREAQELCGSAHQLSPCGYALYEEGATLLAMGQASAAIPILERRLNEYGDNPQGEVSKALKKAQKAAGKTKD